MPAILSLGQGASLTDTEDTEARAWREGGREGERKTGREVCTYMNECTCQNTKSILYMYK